MCNFILLSCDANIDLKQYERDFIRLEILTEDDLVKNPESTYLSYPYKWLLTSKATPGCACGFRHVIHIYHDMGFGVPEDWQEEDDEDIAATKEFYLMVKDLNKQGIKVDSFDLFDHNEGKTNSLGKMEINTSHLDAEAFRFFEQMVFDYKS